MRVKSTAIFVFIIAAVIGCKDDVFVIDTITAVPDVDPLDKVLIDALFEASDGEGPSFYELPTNLEDVPEDPLNPLNPSKVALGKMLFHETGLATHPKKEENLYTYSCASCHHAQGGFQAGVPQGISEGGIGFGIAGEARIPAPGFPIALLDVQRIRTPSILNAAYQEATLWNGAFGGQGVNIGTEFAWYPGSRQETNFMGFEGLEVQAIEGVDVHRLGITETNFNLYGYGDRLKDVFGDLGDTLMSDVYIALAIAAYERTVVASEAPFQRWLRGDRKAMKDSWKEGAILFFGKGNCASCHNGPSLAKMEFHALGMNELDGPGFYETVFENQTVHLGRGGFTGLAQDEYKFKVPQLYNLKDSRFYGHGASFETVLDVVRYKNLGAKENPDCPNSQLAEDFVPLGLTDDEIWSITLFVNEALYDPDLMRYVPSSTLSGFCFPNNDLYSAADLGCQ
jgi:cytochrome c peroxidase